MTFKRHFSLILFCMSLQLAGQSDSIPTDYGLSFSGIGYIKNNEYAPSHLKGYTSLGTLNRVSAFYAQNHIRLEGGLIVQKLFGSTDVLIQPRVLLSFDFLDNFRLNLGNIAEEKRHGLPIGLQDTKYLYERIEEGLSLEYKSLHIYSELWVDWATQIRPTDNFQERFTAGYQWVYTKQTTSHSLTATPIQLMVHHVGGEYDTLDLSILTLVNTHSGIRYLHYLNSDWALGIQSSLYGLWAMDMDKNHPISPQHQTGYMFHIASALAYKQLHTSLGYWRNHHYYAPYAEALLNTTAFQRFEDTFNLSVQYQVVVHESVHFLFDAQVFANAAGFSNYAQIFLTYDLDTSFLGKTTTQR